jgi:flagellar motor switch protein FliG
VHSLTAMTASPLSHTAAGPLRWQRFAALRLWPFSAPLLAALAGVCVALALAAAPARADGGDQVVDSLDALQHRIESMVGERLSALMPRQTYVLRAMVLGHKVMVPRGTMSASSAYELPGFRPSPGQTVASEEKSVVDQVIVRIVLNEELSREDIQYLRTIVPILADFRPERGDRLDLQSLPAFNRQGGGQPGAFPGQPQGGAGQPGQPPQNPFSSPGQQPQGFGQQFPGTPGQEGGLLPSFGAGGKPLTTADWIFIGLLALILLVTLIVMLRVFLMPRAAASPYGMPAYPQMGMPAYAPGAPPGAMRAPPMASAQRGPAPSYGPDADELEQQRQFDSLRAGVIKVLFSRPDIGRLLVQEWQAKSDKLNLMIHALGPQVARQALLPPLGLARYRDLEDEMRGDKTPDTGRMIQALMEANGYLISKELEHPEEIRSDPFGFLDGLTRGQVAHLVKSEPVKIKAIVLSRIKPEDMAFVLEQYPKDVQLEIAVNIGNLHSLPLEMLDGVARDLAENARFVPDSRSVDIEGPTALVDLMGRASADTSMYLLQAMKAKDRKLSEAVEKRFFLFDAIPLVPEDVLPQAVRGMPSAVVIQALTGAPQDLQRKVLMAFPEQARSGLVNSLRASKAETGEVEEARRQVVARFQALARQGKIDLKKISDAWQSQARQSQARPSQPAA